MLAFLSLLTLFCLVQDGFARTHLGARGLTNAQRFARGLPPARPKRLYGSRSESARRTMVSGTPGQTIQGTIQVSGDGYTFYIDSSGFLQSSILEAGTFAYTEPASADTAVELVILDSNGNPSGSYLGFVADGTDTLSSDAFVRMINCQGTTSSGSAPVTAEYGNGSDKPLETTVFMIDPSTGDITTTWINPNNEPAPSIALGEDGEYVYMGSGTGFMSFNGFDAVTSFMFSQS